MNASKTSFQLQKRGIKGVTIDRIVKDTQDNHEITEEDKTNRTRDDGGNRIMSPETFGVKKDAGTSFDVDPFDPNPKNKKKTSRKGSAIFHQKKDANRRLKGVPSCL